MKSIINILLLFLIILIISESIFSQSLMNEKISHQNNIKIPSLNRTLPRDSTKKETKSNKISIGGIFLSIGGGLSVPIAHFNSTSNAKFGILGRVEYSSTAIFPVVAGGEISYFSYKGADNYLTQYFLKTYQTKILSLGLNLDISLSRLLKSYYTIPFICVDVRTNSIKRDISTLGTTLPNVPLKESRVSIGAGLGFTLFVMDFYVKYNYMKDLSSFGIFTKIKFPVIRF